MVSVDHPEGHPFHGIAAGDLIRVIYDGAPAALLQVTEIKQHSLKGNDGDFHCRVTVVSPNDLRFYGKIDARRTMTLRPIKLRKENTYV
jgi:hypothetical protein